LVKVIFDSTAGDSLVDHKQVFRLINGEDYDYKEMRLAGLGAMVQTPEGGNYYIDSPKYGSAKTLNPVKYTLGFRITKEMKMFNRIDAVSRFTKNLRKVMDEGKDIEVHKIYNNATSTTYGAGFDALALASNSHTCLDETPTTYDNYLGSDLSVAAMESALAYFSAVPNDRGFTMNIKPQKLVVNVSMQFKAFKLLEATNQPFEMSNTPNVITKWGLKPVVDRRLSSSTSWFVLGDTNSDDFSPVVITWQEPQIYTRDAPDRTLDTEVFADQLFSYGLFDPRLVYVGNI
jgi:hypothetical protein